MQNLKKTQIMKELRKLQELAGVKSDKVAEIDLEADFDPEKWDEQMEKVFDEDFYNEPEPTKPGPPHCPNYSSFLMVALVSQSLLAFISRLRWLIAFRDRS